MFGTTADGRLTTTDLRQLVATLAELQEEVDDAERVEQIRALEELKAAAAAAQAKVTAVFVTSQRVAQAAVGVPDRDVGRGIAAQVGLAKRESPFRAGRDVGWAGVLVAELPAAFTALQGGKITEWRAQIVARETGWLIAADRRQVNTTTTKIPATPASRDEPALVQGYGPIPAELARRLVQAGTDQPAARVWLRRLYTDPTSGELLTMDSTRRHFPPGLRKLLVLRDQNCRTPWCDAPIRHTDHVTAYATGGRTGADNGQGLCEACNHTKQAPGWITRPGPHGAGTSVTITTPTGHSYLSRPPDPPGHQPPRRTTATHSPPTAVTTVRLASVAEDRFRRLLAAA